VRYYPGSKTDTAAATTPEPDTVCLDVLRFGCGYWIGAVCTTVVGLFADQIITLSDATWGMLYGIAVTAFLLVMFIGTVMAGVEFAQGTRSGNRTAVTGGVFGFILCVWPFIIGPILIVQVLQGW